MKIRVERFTGIAPRLGKKLLPDNAATLAVNSRLESGELRPFTQPSSIQATLVAGAKSVYPLGAPSFKYLSWDVDVDVAPSPIADDESRIYYTGDGAPKKTYLALLGTGALPGMNWLHMGTPGPTTAPTASGTGSGAVTETRTYVYTYLTQFGSVVEESAPSPPVLVTLTSNTGAALSALNNPADLAHRNYVGKRIYRSVGAGAFGLVAEISFATTTYTDTATTIPGDELLTTDWLPPPSDLRGLVVLPSGVMAGFRNNEIWFSEPEFPHAWPAKYMQTVNSKVVAIKAFGNSIAVATQAFPEIGTGVHPESFTFQTVPQRAPCVAKRSMASDEAGAIYACPDGLMALSYDGNGLATAALLTRAEFRLYAPETMVGAFFAQQYFGFYTANGVTQALVFKRGDTPPLVTLALQASALALEAATNRLVAVDAQTNELVYVDPLDTLPMSYRWESKVFELPYPTNMAAVRAIGSTVDPSQEAYVDWLEQQNAAITAENATRFTSGNLGGALNDAALSAVALDGDALRPLFPVPDTKIMLYVYADSDLVLSVQADPNEVVRLPSGFTAKTWRIGVAGQVPLQALEMASSVEELVA